MTPVLDLCVDVWDANMFCFDRYNTWSRSDNLAELDSSLPFFLEDVAVKALAQWVWDGTSETTSSAVVNDIIGNLTFDVRSFAVGSYFVNLTSRSWTTLLGQPANDVAITASASAVEPVIDEYLNLGLRMDTSFRGETTGYAVQNNMEARVERGGCHHDFDDFNYTGREYMRDYVSFYGCEFFDYYDCQDHLFYTPRPGDRPLADRCCECGGGQILFESDILNGTGHILHNNSAIGQNTDVAYAAALSLVEQAASIEVEVKGNHELDRFSGVEIVGIDAAIVGTSPIVKESFLSANETSETSVALGASGSTDFTWNQSIVIVTCGAADVCVDAGGDDDRDKVCDDVDPCLDSIDNTDADNDGVCGTHDSCPRDPYGDIDSDGICHQSDPCPYEPDVDECTIVGCPPDLRGDADSDSICGVVDFCPQDAENDADSDRLCHNVDSCPYDASTDGDADGLCGHEDSCPLDDQNDVDGDAICGDVDSCPFDAENDTDNDDLCSSVDSCPESAENDSDSDGVCHDRDTCPTDPTNDIDSDGICGSEDSCPNDADNDQDNDNICGDIDDCPDGDVCLSSQVRYSLIAALLAVLAVIVE